MAGPGLGVSATVRGVHHGARDGGYGGGCSFERLVAPSAIPAASAVEVSLGDWETGDLGLFHLPVVRLRVWRRASAKTSMQ